MYDVVTSRERKDLFDILCHKTAACRACPRLTGRSALLSRRNGTLVPKVLFVGEAPGQLAADRPGAMRAENLSTRDPAAGRFEELLASIDLGRDEIFVTYTVLCTSTHDGEAISPCLEETRNCSHFLRDTLTLLSPPVVATLGAAALRAVGRIIRRPLVLTEAAGTLVECDDFVLVPLYHPGPDIPPITRSFQQQKADFAAVLDAIEWTTTAAV